jgi:hypothetical protein
MAYNCIRLSDGTEVCLDDATGFLHFTGKDFYKYHHVARDTRDIYLLLLEHGVFDNPKGLILILSEPACFKGDFHLAR